MADLGWTEYESRTEAALMGSCFDAAERAGHSREQAEICDDGELGCPDCPFRKVD